jgi:hypothetical protein
LVGTVCAFAATVIDLLTSDPVILVMSCVGLVATAASIVRDTRAQRQQSSSEMVYADSRELAA